MSNRSSKVSVFARSRTGDTPLSPPARIGALLLGLMLSSLILIASAAAATITVGNPGDPATGNAANCNAASTCTLRDAIAKAANVTGSAVGDTVVFSLPANSTITLSGSELLVDRNLTIDGSAVSGLAISGDRQSRVFEIDAHVVAVLKQLVIKNGKANVFGRGGGGGIYNSGVLALTGSTVSESTAGSEGGGISNDGTLVLTDSTVVGSSATWGGGICNGSHGTLTLVDSNALNNTADWGGGIYNNGAFTLDNSTVSSNTAAGGGGIYNLYSESATLTDSTISDNTAGGYGGIYNGGTLTLTRSTVSGNTANYGDGGGIYNQHTLTLGDSTVSGNTTSHGGGGIYNGYDTTTLTLTGSSVSGNTSSLGGGGIINYHTAILANSTVSGNATVGNGGGIVNYANLTLINSTVTGNTTDSMGGGIFNDYALTLIHSTLSGNIVAGAKGDIHNGPYSGAASAANTIIHRCEVDGSNTRALIDNGGNLDGGNRCGFTDVRSKSNATLDLGALADNGGPTLTLRPGAGSDAIGHGVPAVCDDAPVNGKDQRGYARSTRACTSGAVDPANDSINLNQHGLSGSWVDPTASSQGLVMEIGPDFYGAGTGLLFAGWYTFDVSAAGGQRWYTLQAQVSGTTPASVGIYESSGGRFDSPQATTTTEVGRATLAFSDCTHGTLDYTFNDGSGRSGRIPLTRLLSNTTCSPTGDSGNAALPTLLSGAWADAANSAQGLVFDMNAADNVVFAGWYTYAPDAAMGGGAAGQRWYTLQATFQPGTSTPNSVGIYESTGGTFNAPANAQTTQVGTASLIFNSCTSATLQYTFTGGANSGKNGTLDLTRVGATPSGCHL